MRKLIALLCAVLVISVFASCNSGDANGTEKPTEDGVMTEVKDDDGNLTG